MDIYVTTVPEFSHQLGQLSTVLMRGFFPIFHVINQVMSNVYITNTEHKQELLVGLQCLSCNLV